MYWLRTINSIMTAEENQLTVRISTGGADVSDYHMLLSPGSTRSVPTKKRESITSFSGMRLFDCEKMSEALNGGYMSHRLN